MFMKREKISKKVAKGVTSSLNSMLRVEANSASCVIAYQPKTPKELARFKKEKC